MKISELWKQVSIQMFEQILLCLISKKFISSSESVPNVPKVASEFSELSVSDICLFTKNSEIFWKEAIKAKF